METLEPFALGKFGLADQINLMTSGSLQIHMLDGNQAMTEHVDGSLALLQDDVTDQRLVLTIGRFHFDKGDFR